MEPESPWARLRPNAESLSVGEDCRVTPFDNLRANPTYESEPPYPPYQGGEELCRPPDKGD